MTGIENHEIHQFESLNSRLTSYKLRLTNFMIITLESINFFYFPKLYQLRINFIAMTREVHNFKNQFKR